MQKKEPLSSTTSMRCDTLQKVETAVGEDGKAGCTLLLGKATVKMAMGESFWVAAELEEMDKGFPEALPTFYTFRWKSSW